MPTRRRRKPRPHEWTRAKMAEFLRELAATQSVPEAARAVGMSRQSAYGLRNRLAGTPFSLGWEVALEAGLHQLHHAVMDRAVNGVEVPHYYHGKLVGTSRRYDNRLASWVLGNTWKVGRHQVAREYVIEGFDRLLERIEWDNLDWVAEDELPGRVPPPLPELDEDGFPIEEEEPAPETAASRDQGRFLAGRSWYYANAGEPAPRGAQGGHGGRR